MPATPANGLNISSAGLVKFDGTATFSGVTVTQHDVLIGAASNGITSVAPSATSGVPLISQGASADPAFGTAVVAGGGTGATSFTSNGVLYGNGTSAINVTAQGGAHTVLTANSGAPSFSATPQLTALGLGAAAGASGLTFDGTNLLTAYSTGSWTPTDASGASLSFSTAIGSYVRVGGVVIASCEVVYPATADGSSAAIGGLPFTSNASAANRGGYVSYSNVTTLRYSIVNAGATTFGLYNSAGSPILNSAMTGSTSLFQIIYNL